MKQVSYLVYTAVLFCLVALCATQAIDNCPLVNQVALYRLTFTGEFTAENQLNSYGPFALTNSTAPVGQGNTSAAIPNSAFPFDNQSLSCNDTFFGPLIGATHSYSDVNYLWENAGRVTPSFAAYVTGQQTSGSRLRNYINTGINKGKFNQLLFNPETTSFNGTTSIEFYINYTAPFVDVVLSINPSPDWFVGVSKLPLFEQGHWYRYIAIDLYAWDAGVRDGQDFESTPTETVPQYWVSSLRNRYPFLEYQNPIGVMVFERLDNEECAQNGVTFYSEELVGLVNISISDTPCVTPIPYSLGTPAGVDPGCYEANNAAQSSN